MEASCAPEASSSTSIKRQAQHTEYDKLMTFLWKTERQAAKEAAETADDFMRMLIRRSSSATGRLQIQQRLERDHQWVVERKERVERMRSARTPKPLPEAPKIRSRSCRRDPQRLLRPTSASIARYLPDEEEEEDPTDQSRSGGYILDVSSRFVASTSEISHQL